MPRIQSLDELISRKAAEFADGIKGKPFSPSTWPVISARRRNSPTTASTPCTRPSPRPPPQGPDFLQPVEDPLRRSLRLRRRQPFRQDQEARRLLRRAGKGLKPAELLFAVHTYYALFMKLLASEIIAFFHKLPTPLQKMMQAGTSTKLKRGVDELEAGSIFRHLNITNFLEGDLFAWYLPVWSDRSRSWFATWSPGWTIQPRHACRKTLPAAATCLRSSTSSFSPRASATTWANTTRPTGSPSTSSTNSDTLATPINACSTPPAARAHSLSWPSTAFGAGTTRTARRCRFGEDELCRKILANVIGFDLNPLAVMAARTNYLIAIRDLIGHVDKVEIPVYLCDSILTPSTMADCSPASMDGEGTQDCGCQVPGSQRRLPRTGRTSRSMPSSSSSASRNAFCPRNSWSVARTKGCP